MTVVLTAIVIFAKTVLRVLDVALLIRALMSWVMPGEQNRFTELIYAITEPVLIPFRILFSKFGFARTCPIDLSFLAACITLAIISETLPAVVF